MIGLSEGAVLIGFILLLAILVATVRIYWDLRLIRSRIDDLPTRVLVDRIMNDQEKDHGRIMREAAEDRAVLYAVRHRLGGSTPFDRENDNGMEYAEGVNP